MSPDFDEVDTFVLSEDGEHIAYGAKRSGHWVLVQDGRIVPFDDTVTSATALALSRDGRRLAYTVARGSEEVTVMVDGSEIGRHKQVTESLFSPDGRRFAYIAGEAKNSSASKKANDKGKKDQDEVWRVILAGRPGDAFDEISSLRFSLDSQHVAFVASQGEGHRLVKDGRLSASYDIIIGDSDKIYAAKRCFRAIAVRGQAVRQIEWYY